jgi:hypothetical protein
MSAGGLLASMIGGAARSGVAMADKISTENRQNVKDEEKYQQGLLASQTNHGRQVERDTLQYDRQKERDSLNHQRSITLAGIKNRSTSSNKLDPKIKLRVTTLTDLIKAEKNSSIPDDNAIKGYMNELNDLTGISGSDTVEKKPGLETLNLKIRGGAAQTEEQKKQERRTSELQEKESKEAAIESRTNKLLSGNADAQQLRAKVENLIRRQDNNEQLSMEENALLLKLQEESQAQIKEPEINITPRTNPSANQSHINATNRFLQQNR